MAADDQVTLPQKTGKKRSLPDSYFQDHLQSEAKPGMGEVVNLKCQ